MAYRCGVDYQAALKLFDGEPERAWLRGFYCGEVVEALGRAGFCYRFDEFDPRTHAPLLEKEGTIVFIEPCPAYPAGHYMIRAGTGWMNSWSNYPLLAPVRASYQHELPGRVGHIVYESPSEKAS